MFSKGNWISGFLARCVWKVSCCRRCQFLLGHVLPKIPPLSELEGPIHLKRPLSAYVTYISQRYMLRFQRREIVILCHRKGVAVDESSTEGKVGIRLSEKA